MDVYGIAISFTITTLRKPVTQLLFKRNYINFSVVIEKFSGFVGQQFNIKLNTYMVNIAAWSKSGKGG